jgi:hypothetical protein
MNVQTAPAREARNEADIMRGDEDQFRYYVPLLRRIVILVAVITAIPVILWTTTAFVRTYVAPPKVPTFRPITATASIATPPVPAGSAAAPSAAPVVEARATATDARDAAPAAKGPLLADRLADVNANAGAGASAPKVADVTATAPAGAAPKADTMKPMTFDTPPQTGAATAAQQPPSAQPAGSMDATADALPAAAPLSGRIPLPRRRPPNLTMAQLGVPIPRPRPDTTGDSGSDTTGANPLGWIRSIFQPQQSQPQSEQQ